MSELCAGLTGARPPEPPADVPVDTVSRVRGWIAALQLAGALAALGFIARFAREQFQGIHGGDWSVSELTIEAGRFAVDSFVIPLTFAFSHLPSVIAVIVLFIMMGVLLTWSKPPLWVEWLVHACALAALAFALLYVFLQYEAPTFPLQSWLAGGLPSSQIDFGRDTFINRRALEVSKLLLASRLPLDSDRSQVTLLVGFPLNYAAAKAKLEARYSLSIFICFAGWLYFLLTSRPSIANRSELLIDRSRLVVLLILVVVTSLVPYMYGKLIESTTLPEADIGYKELDSSTCKNVVHSSKLDSGTCKNVVLTFSGVPVLAQTDKAVTVLAIGPQGLSSVVEVPRDRLLYLHLWGTVDPLSKLVQRPAPPPPPPPGGP